MHTRNYFKIKIFWKRLSKSLKKVNFVFSFKPSPFSWIKLSKTKGAWYYWPVALQVAKQVKKNVFISNILSDQVWWYNIKWFLSYSKNYICYFIEANSWHHKLFHFHLSFWIWKVWKRREKITKIWMKKGKKLFKKHFSHFLKGSHLVKK